MKVTKKYLKKIINEEITKILDKLMAKKSIQEIDEPGERRDVEALGMEKTHDAPTPSELAADPNSSYIIQRVEGAMQTMALRINQLEEYFRASEEAWTKGKSVIITKTKE